jgi:translation initiation factor 4E
MEESFETETTKEEISSKKTDSSQSSAIFSKTWVFWESYTSKTLKLSYEDTNKPIFKWSDVITFFQFWNRYPGNDIKNIFYDGNEPKFFFNEEYRINSMNIFVDGIKPMWEDPQNKGGKYLQLEYQIKKNNLDDFFKAANFQWKKLALCTMGMSLPGAEYINGIRIIDKTDFERGRTIMFRIEIWISKNMERSMLNDLIEFLKKSLGCEKINVKNID